MAIFSHSAKTRKVSKLYNKYVYIPICLAISTIVLGPNLCSHLYALCFTAQSLFKSNQSMYAKRCSDVCPHLSIFQLAKLLPAINGHTVVDDNVPAKISVGLDIARRWECQSDWHVCLFITPHICQIYSARGSYCLSATEKPYCPTDKNAIGDTRCCSLRQMLVWISCVVILFCQSMLKVMMWYIVSFMDRFGNVTSINTLL